MKILIKLIITTLLLIKVQGMAFGQCPTSDFDVLPIACIDERILVSNNSVNFSDYTWSFCDNNYLGSITGNELLTLSNISAPRDIVTAVVSEGIYSFIIGENNRLIRLFFGDEINNTPQQTNFQDVNGALSIPKGIEYYQENGNHYLLVALQGGTLVLLDFGIDLSSTPTSSLVSGINSLISIKGLKLNKLHDGSIILYAVGIGAGSRQIGVINFGNSILNIPTYSEFSLPSAAGLTSLSLIKDCDQWYGVVTSSINNKLFKLFFGNDPTTLNSDQEVIGIVSPHAIDIKWINSKFYALSTSESGDLFRIDFGTDFSLTGSEVFENLGNPGGLASTIGFDIFPIDNNYQALAIGYNDKKLTHLAFSGDCSVVLANQQENLDLLFTESGTIDITLTTFNNIGNVDRLTKSVVVSTDTAPDITFSSQNICLSNSINFTSENISGDIISYSWDFGDANTSPNANPSHTYASAGEYEVTLEVESSNGCHNFTKQTIKIYNPPIPSFTLPLGSICTNENYTFVNNTIENFDGNLTYEWQVDGEIVSTERDLIHQFTNGGAKEIKLITSIPGCDVEQIQNIPNVSLGAVSSYTYDINSTCLGDPITFTNQSTGTGIIGYTWNFGDTNASNDISPTHTFVSPATYTVSLEVTNEAGCITTYQEEITIHSLPITDFSVELVCTDRNTQLSDLTTVNNANITSWDWDFGDISSGSNNFSSDKNPTHIFSGAGEYNVTLSAVSNYGCEHNIDHVVTVLESPEVDFEVESGCVGEAFLFTDISIPNSGGSIISHTWNINGSVYTVQNPSHTFSNSGNYLATLTIRSDNLCAINVSRTITVNELPIADFSLTSYCTNTEVTLEDQSIMTNDNVANWQWTINDQDAGNTSSIMHTFEEATTYKIELQITTERGCTVSAQQNIPFFELPVADFNPIPQYGIAPAEITFDNLSNNAVSYEWRFGDNSNNSTENSPSHTYTDLGTYDVSLTVQSDEGCIDETTRQVYIINPEIDLSIDEINTFNDGKNLLFTLSNHGTIPVGNITASVSFNNNTSINEDLNMFILPNQKSIPKTLSFTLPEDGNIEFLCITLSTSEGVDINETNNTQCINIDSDFEVFNPYPSPVSCNEVLTLPLVGQENDEVTVTLVDASGKQHVFENIKLPQAGLHNFGLSLPFLSAGVYFIQVVSIKTTKTFRIFVN